MADINVNIKLNDNTSLNIDKTNGLKLVESLSQSTGQPKEIFYGVVPSIGSLEIIDVNGQIAKMVTNGTLPNSNVKVNIFANSKQVQTHLSTNSDYNINSQSFSVDLENQIGKWDYLEFLGRNANGKGSVYDILKDIFGEDVDNMLNTKMVYGESIEGSVKEYVQSITMDYPYLIKGTLQETINKICAVAQLNVFQDDDGNIKFVSARPIYTHSDKIISIPSKNIMGPPIRDIILKNQYGYVEINERKFNRTINVKYPIYNILNYEPLDSELFSQLNTISKLSDGSTTSSNPAVRYIENSFGSETTFWGVMTYLEGIYCKFNVVVPKKSNYNLTQITAINTSNENINAQVTYRIYNASATSNTRYPTIDNFTIGEYVDTQNEYVGSIDDKFSYKSWNTVNGETLGIDMELPKSNQYIKIVSEDENNYNLEVCVLVGRKSMSDTDSGSPSSLDWTTTIRYLKPLKFDMSIYGNNYEITFDDNLIPLGSSDSIYSISLESNELLQDSTMYSGEKLSYIIGNNILNDYKNGIHTAQITCTCSDYFDIDGKKVKDWAKGDILQIGDIVRVDKDNLGNSAIKYANGKDMYFKVVGRKFKKQGIALLDLELQEVKKLQLDGGLYSDSSYTTQIASWDELIDSGTITVNDDFTTLKKVNSSIDGYLKISSIITEISPYACEKCVNLKGVDLNNVTTIQNGAFSRSGLQNITLTENITSIKMYTFSNCASLTSVVMPNTITKIETDAFYASGLTSITIPNSVITLEPAFNECKNLHSVSIGNGLKRITGFGGCTSLREIEIPNNIEVIEYYAFADCMNLSWVFLNDGLEVINDGAFNNCNIYEITIPSTTYYIGTEAFSGCSELTTATFERLTGWRVSGLNSIDVSDVSQNAIYLKDTYAYDTWYNDELSPS